jgi:four helix bundle protein
VLSERACLSLVISLSSSSGSWETSFDSRSSPSRRTALCGGSEAAIATDDAAESVCRNIAEGFACKTDKEFARFVRIGRRSLNEVQDCFLSARFKRYVTEADLVQARRLMRRLYPAIASFLSKLDP